MQIIYSPKSKTELENIHDYLIENFGSRIASEKIDMIRDDITRLSCDPFFGRLIVDGIRKLNSGMSMIIYEVQEKYIEIHHVVDCRTDWARTLFPKEI